MEYVINLITNNKEVIEGLVVIAISLAVYGKQKAKQEVLKFVTIKSEDFLLNVDEHAPAYAKYIYAKLPKRARLFLSIKLIEKLIRKFAKEVKFNLDKK
jgi:hypothetical protein